MSELEFNLNPKFLDDATTPERLIFREKAFAQFKKLGLPKSRSENWRYNQLDTDFIASLASNGVIEPNKFKANASVSKLLPLLPFSITSENIIIFINGSFSDQLINSHNIKSLPFASTTVEQLTAMEALSLSFSNSGTCLNIEQEVSTPIVIFHIIYENSLINVCHEINLVNSTKATVIECYLNLSPKNSMLNSRTALNLAKNSQLNHCSLQISNNHNHIQILSNTATLQENSHLKMFSFAKSGTLQRLDQTINLSAKHSSCDFSSILTPEDKSSHDINLTINHLAPNCSSDTCVRGAIASKAKATFTGKIVVHPHAHETNANLQHKHLLLSDKAQVNSRPQLEIYNDDVKCSHGSAIGKLDEDALFYMSSRGISIDEALRMLITSFLKQATDKIFIPEVKSWVEQSNSIQENF